MEEAVRFRSGELALEGLFESGRANRGVVITHPHPLYGGDMQNPVVDAIRSAYRAKDVATLRFNFRGTGSSQGCYDNGAGERDDVAAALALMRDSGIRIVELAGYSFGAWVNALTHQRDGLSEDLVMVSPPVEFIDFTSIGPLPGLRLVVTGSRDEMAPPAVIRRMMPAWNPSARSVIIGGADHFYGRSIPLLMDTLRQHI
jgi:alpha/beta superfamily hydrolase